jgi:hypothetical protein
MGDQSALVTALLHFLELKSELDLLRSGQNVDLSDDQANAIWPLVSMASTLLALLVPLFAHDHPDDVHE